MNRKMKARNTGVVSSGELFATFDDTRVDLNNITGPFRDNLVQLPEYKMHLRFVWNPWTISARQLFA